jgi:hypothetical protein
MPGPEPCGTKSRPHFRLSTPPYMVASRSIQCHSIMESTVPSAAATWIATRFALSELGIHCSGRAKMAGRPIHGQTVHAVMLAPLVSR